jgi:hypothetical protein
MVISQGDAVMQSVTQRDLMPHRRSAIRVRACWILALALCDVRSAIADDVSRVQGKAPPNYDVLKHERGGAYFVARPLKEQYDQLLGRVNLLKTEIDAGQISGANAKQELLELQGKLELLRLQIDESKVLVTPAKVRTQSETTSFELGPERLLVITADNMRVEGWDGPNVKCVLEKTVLSANDAPVEEQFKGMKLVHRHGRASEIVGQSREEVDEGERQFLNSQDGKSLNDKQREARKRFVDKIAESYAVYREFQGKEIDTLEIEGLTYQQGNRQIVVDVSSDGGGASKGSLWQRHAAVTIYVPAAQAVTLRGCSVKLNVQGLNAPLIVTNSGSLDRDYDGEFQIADLHGSLTVQNTAIDYIEDIHGDVSITSTVELANTGTQYSGDTRRMYTPPPRVCDCRNIDGDFVAWFSRVDLRLQGITGKIDVKNEFGNTRLYATKPLAAKSHRIISECGRIELDLSKSTLASLRLLAVTNCGGVQTNIPNDILEERSFTVGHDLEFGGRAWHGMMTKQPDRFSYPSDFERPGKAFRGLDRPDGFDAISRSGTVILTAER